MLAELKAVIGRHVKAKGEPPKWVLVPYLKLLDLQRLSNAYWRNSAVHYCVCTEGIRAALSHLLDGKLEGVNIVVPAALDYEGPIEVINAEETT